MNTTDSGAEAYPDRDNRGAVVGLVVNLSTPLTDAQ